MLNIVFLPHPKSVHLIRLAGSEFLKWSHENCVPLLNKPNTFSRQRIAPVTTAQRHNSVQSSTPHTDFQIVASIVLIYNCMSCYVTAVGQQYIEPCLLYIIELSKLSMEISWVLQLLISSPRLLDQVLWPCLKARKRFATRFQGTPHHRSSAVMTSIDGLTVRAAHMKRPPLPPHSTSVPTSFAGTSFRSKATLFCKH